MTETPCYIFDIDALKARIELLRSFLPGIPLTFSVKANSFIVKEAEALVDHIEVCSPGELAVCKRLSVTPEKIIYSGVMKEEPDILEAVRYGAGILTAESLQQAEWINRAAEQEGKSIRVLLRVSSGNQFGMDRSDILKIIRNRKDYQALRLIGFHYYSGTQKKKADHFRRDFEQLADISELCRTEFGFSPALVEYGPGLAVEYFKEEPDKADLELLKLFAEIAGAWMNKMPLGIELGRFMAASCGSYLSTVKDIKTTEGTHYAILDGGIHHLKYYGQMMAMNCPPIRQKPERMAEEIQYTICGSLCTTADVLARTKLKELHTGDVLAFEKCGAYSVTEASSLFLSRDLPAVYLKKEGKIQLQRRGKPSYILNLPER